MEKIYGTRFFLHKNLIKHLFDLEDNNSATLCGRMAGNYDGDYFKFVDGVLHWERSPGQWVVAPEREEDDICLHCRRLAKKASKN